jgi:hypothetical protein
MKKEKDETDRNGLTRLGFLQFFRGVLGDGLLAIGKI